MLVTASCCAKELPHTVPFRFNKRKNFQCGPRLPKLELGTRRCRLGMNDGIQQTPSATRQPRQAALPGCGQMLKKHRNDGAFWILGMLNNSAYVVMIAGANEVSPSAVGLTYLCAILPALAVKASGPYWFHYLSYGSRSVLVAVLMSSSYLAVAYGTNMTSQLFGVVLGSLQGGLGEATCLALSAFYDSRSVITFWSSGTGFAGVLGYAWVAILHVFLGLSFQSTLLLANLSTAAWLACYFLLLETPVAGRASRVSEAEAGSTQLPQRTSQQPPSQADSPSEAETADLLSDVERVPSEGAQKQSRVQHMTARERWLRTSALWPYMIPLILVYFAEYSMQAGAWTAMGFPPTDPAKRIQFYTYSNWCYQAGVFVSRSSGLIYQASIGVLWAMPVAQLGFLVFFSMDAYLHFWQNYCILLPCLVTGLLGGLVYVNAFTLISRDVEAEYREFSLSAASLGDSMGIAFADIFGILLQGCLFKANHIPGAAFAC